MEQITDSRAPVPTAQWATPLAVLVAGALLVGCGSSGSTEAHRPAPPTASTIGGELSISIDGSMRDWRDDIVAIADARYLYLRFAPGLDHPIQNAPISTHVLLDLDDDRSTGVAEDTAMRFGLGVDLELRFSPHIGEDASRGGVEVWRVGENREREQIGHDAVGLIAAPTVATEWYELRIDRVKLAESVGAPAEASSGRAVFALTEPDGDGGAKLIGWSEPVAITAPARADSPARAAVQIPAKPEGAVRVVSWNVLRGAPMKDTGGFAGVLDVLEPDIVLVQEWDGADDESLASWFNALVPGSSPWNARTGAGWGVGVVARHPILPMGPVHMQEPGRDGAMRYLGAMVATPHARVAAASVHLKCCGTAGSEEDRRRSLQAEIMREQFASDAVDADIAVIGGDLNLVGSRQPLSVMVDGADLDGSDLTVAQPGVLGDRANYTWRDGPSRFGPGRLDYLMYSDAGAELVNAFVLDLERFDDGSLARAGLYRADTSSSDHLPLVIDLMPSD
ncbi:MAG: endonuclease/exonuclease/phosphatase family protein [Planctomycetota bacterium]